MFQKQKQTFLNKKDKSKEGEIDKDIQELVDKINASNDFFTTSSCSGRIVLIEREEGKKGSKWLLKTHNKTTLEEVKEALKNAEKEAHFKLEPAIIHVRARDVHSADKLLKTAYNVGFKRGGIISLGDKIILELRSTESANVVLMKELVNDEFLNLLIKDANKKLESTRNKINKFSSGLQV